MKNTAPTAENKLLKIAVPTADGKLCMHFGHCEKFVIADVDESKHIVGKEEAVPPAHEPGILPKWLHEKGVNVIIAGGMGMRTMRERAELLGGQLSVASSRGNGTSVLFRAEIKE